MSKPLRVLMVEDCEDDAVLLLHELRKAGYAPTYRRVQTREEMSQALETDEWDVVTSDHTMPNFSAPEALELLQELRPEVPLVIVSGEIDLNLAVSLMKAGAKDYIQKSQLAKAPPAIERELADATVRGQRVAALHALRRSEETSRVLLNAPGDPSLLVDPHGNLIAVNEAAGRLFGYAPSDMVGTNAFGYLSDTASREYRSVLQSIVRTGMGCHFEDRFDGRIVDVRAFPVFDAKGGTDRVAVSVRDISEHKRLEDALRDSEARYRRISESLSDFIYTAQVRDGRIAEVFVAAGSQVTTGYLLDDFRTNPGLWRRIVPEDDRPMMQQAVASLAAGEEPDPIVHRILRKDGVVRWVSHTLIPLTREAGRVVSFDGVLRDVTERRQTEQAWREAQAELSGLMGNMPGMAFRCRQVPRRRMLYVSEGCLPLTGYSAAALVADDPSFEKLIHPDDRAAVEVEILSAIEAGRPYVAIYRLTAADGKQRWVREQGRAVPGPRSDTDFVEGFATDITSNKVLEASVATVVAGTSSLVGQQFFRSLVAELARVLNVHTAFVGRRIEGQPGKMLVVAINTRGALRERAVIDLHGTPCADVLDGSQQCIVDDASSFYPEDAYLQANGIRSFVGVPLKGIQGAELGILGVLDDHPTIEREVCTSVLGIFAVRAVAELERLGMEHARAKAEQRFELLFANMANAVTFNRVVRDENGRFIDYEVTEVNPQFSAQTGRPADEVIGRLASSFEDVPSAVVFSAAEDAVLSGAHRQVEAFDETTGRHLSISVAPLDRDTFATIVRDVTEQKRSEEALHQRVLALTSPSSETPDLRLENLFDLEEAQLIQDVFATAAKVTSVITDTHGRPLTRPSNLHGLCEDVLRRSIKGQSACLRAVALEHGDDEPNPLVQTCPCPGMFHGIVRIVVGDKHVANWFIGQAMDIDADMEKVRAYGRKIGANPDAFEKALAEVNRMSREQFRCICEALHFISAHLCAFSLQNLNQARDITAREKAERDLRELAEQLEQRVSDRTRQIEEANQELEAFNYSVSHDLRSPLRHIDGYSAMIAEDYGDELPETARQCLDRVRAGVRRMTQLIDDLLRLSHVTSAELRREPVDLSHIARTVVEMLFDSDLERRVEFIAAPGLTADADPNLVRIVLENLIGNAWKFTGQRKNARIEFGQCRADGQTAWFVRDNGAGFDMRYSDQLFRAFRRLHRESEFEGTGIGLATVRRIVRRHGGRVWAEGEVDHGATFYFTLS